MNFKDYQQAALRTANDKCLDIRNCQLGLAGEAGEFADLIKKWAFHGHDLDKDKALKELGDVLWYLAVYCRIRRYTLDGIQEEPFRGYTVDSDEELVDVAFAISRYAIQVGDGELRYTILLMEISAVAEYLGSSLEEVMQMNVDKLMARYPEGFDSNRSINREE